MTLASEEQMIYKRELMEMLSEREHVMVML